MKTKIALALVAALLLTAGVVIWEGWRSRESARSAADLEGKRAELDRRIAAAESILRAARDATAALEQQVAAVQEPAAGAPPASPLPRNPLTRIANDPAKMAAYVRDFRASLDLTYGGLRTIPGFSPELFEKMKDLKTSFEQRRMDILVAAEMQGMDLKGPAYRALQKEETAEQARREAELLGPLLDAYREFDNTQDLRYIVRRLGSCEIYPDKPLTSVEVEQTIGILAQHAQRSRDGSVRTITINLREATPQLQGILSPAAFDLWRWAPPTGIDDAIVARTEHLIAPLNASLPAEKRRGPWALYSDMSTGPK